MRRQRATFGLLLLALLQTVLAAKNRGWLGQEQLVRGDAPLARQGYGIAAVEDLSIMFGGDVLGSMFALECLSVPMPCLTRAFPLHTHDSSIRTTSVWSARERHSLS